METNGTVNLTDMLENAANQVGGTPTASGVPSPGDMQAQFDQMMQKQNELIDTIKGLRLDFMAAICAAGIAANEDTPMPFLSGCAKDGVTLAEEILNCIAKGNPEEGSTEEEAD